MPRAQRNSARIPARTTIDTHRAFHFVTFNQDTKRIACRSSKCNYSAKWAGMKRLCLHLKQCRGVPLPDKNIFATIVQDMELELKRKTEMIKFVQMLPSVFDCGPFNLISLSHSISIPNLLVWICFMFQLNFCPVSGINSLTGLLFYQ